MATYAVGDIQGCMRTFEHLLKRLAFTPNKDQLIIVGDLVNRGADSLRALQWAYDHRDSITLVLGNHDLALLAYACGVRPHRHKDTLDCIVRAPDAARLLGWLRMQPLAAQVHGRLVIHAGVLPQWDEAQVMAQAAAVQEVLQGAQHRTLLRAIEAYAEPEVVDPTIELATEAARVLTYLRTITRSGQPDYSYKGPAHVLPPHLIPWFQAPLRRTQQTTILCGHWAALGLHTRDNVRALDTGCVWGGPLTAWRFEDDAIISQPNVELKAVSPA